MPRSHPADLDEQALLSQCEISRTRRGGPGGQRRNKVETAVVVTHLPTGLRVSASQRRSQTMNLRRATRQLRMALALQVRRPVEGEYRPSTLWQSRCQDGKVTVSLTHRDLPALIAEALDVIVANDHDPSAAARTLGCTASQLIKLLKTDPRALSIVNVERQKFGKHMLK